MKFKLNERSIDADVQVALCVVLQTIATLGVDSLF